MKMKDDPEDKRERERERDRDHDVDRDRERDRDREKRDRDRDRDRERDRDRDREREKRDPGAYLCYIAYCSLFRFSNSKSPLTSVCVFFSCLLRKWLAAVEVVTIGSQMTGETGM